MPPRDRAAVCLYFQDDLTQSDIGQRLGVSQMQVSRILERSLARLRELPRGSRPGGVIAIEHGPGPSRGKTGP